jgi:hypothetical protein
MYLNCLFNKNQFTVETCGSCWIPGQIFESSSVIGETAVASDIILAYNELDHCLPAGINYL